jgi:hypothetical protein
MGSKVSSETHRSDDIGSSILHDYKSDNNRCLLKKLGDGGSGSIGPDHNSPPIRLGIHVALPPQQAAQDKGSRRAALFPRLPITIASPRKVPLALETCGRDRAVFASSSLLLPAVWLRILVDNEGRKEDAGRRDVPLSGDQLLWQDTFPRDRFVT